MENFELKKIQVGEEILAYREGGRGSRQLLLIHGNMSSSLHFEPLMQSLEEDFKIYAVDLRGFGHSSYHCRFDDLKTLSEDLEIFMDTLRLKEVDLLGWSTGGGIAMHLAASRPDLVKSLILMESVGIKGYPIFEKDQMGQPILSKPLLTKDAIEKDPIQVLPVNEAIKNKDKAFFTSLWNMLIYNVGNTPNPSDYDRYNDEILKQRNLVDIDYALTRFNISHDFNGFVEGTGEISSIQCPVLIFQGENDLVVPMEMAKSIEENLKADVEFCLLKNCGHNPMVDALNEVVEKIKVFS